WNAVTEAARVTRGLRMASTADRLALLDRVAAAVLAQSTPLDPSDPVPVPEEYRRPDGASVFTRTGEHAFSHPQLLEAERRLLDANAATGAPCVPEQIAHRIATSPQPTTGPKSADRVRLADDQVAAVVTVATSGRQLDVLVGPAGTGKTTTLRALRAAWETTHGRGSVLGLAPSATAAHELSAALGITCENTAKWLHEITGPGGQRRAAVLDGLAQRRAAAAVRGDLPAVRRIDAACAALQREQNRWSLRAGQLLVVDEASLAGTLALDALREQAVGAGAKVLLVGDHHQLSSVDAGGAFRLLAEHGTGVELRSLWRFRHRWEAWATRRLRHGDPEVVGEYGARGRIQDGPAEAMLEAAYRGWQGSEHAGHAAVLVAVDTRTVEALNTRAHDDRVAAGLVATDGVPLGAHGERGQVGVGDRVVARLNQRRLVVPGHGHVRNGSLWTVVATHPDGSLSVSPADRHVSHGCQPDPACVVTLPAAYVAEHVDLGYATTAHRAQGLTVEACHVLVAPGMSREALYVAMTRGRDANVAYVATDAVDPACDQLPDGQVERSGRDILTQILATSGAELSATQTLRQRREAATSLNTLVPIRETLASQADLRRWEPLLTTCGLTSDQAAAVLASPTRGALFAALREGDSLGHPMPKVLARLVGARPLDGAHDPARDVAAVLHERVDRWLETAPDLSRAERSPASRLGLATGGAWDADDPTRAALAQVEELITERIGTLTEIALGTRPTWLQPFTGGYVHPDEHETWHGHVAVVAAYRDLTGTDAASVLGPDRSTDDVERRRRRAAGHAAVQAHRLSQLDRERCVNL
ncbi:MAG: ATP-dependent DNA helicase, partial [Actinomycetota bacterium]